MPRQGRLGRSTRLGRLVCLMLSLTGLTACGTRGAQPAPEIDSLTVALPHELITLDPHAQDTLSNFAILGNVYEALVSSDATLQLEPGLAERWESPDRLTWLFKLRAARFHDGHELEAADVVYTVRRLLDDPNLDVRGYVWNVASIEALDARTVRLRTHTPWPTLLAKLTQVYVVRAGSDPKALARVANGTGPYRLAEWRRGESVRLARFEGHWAPRAAVREALLLQRDCASLRTTELDGGSVDVVGTACPERQAAPPGWRVERRTGLYVKYLGMDVARARTPFVAGRKNPFRDLRVRQALSLAVDREALVRGLGLPARPAFQPVPMSVLGFNPRLVPEAHDPARARRLLAEAGFPGGFQVMLHVRSLLRQPAAALAADLVAVGMRAELEYVDDAEFSARLSRRESSLWLSRFGCVGGDASDLFEAFFGGVRRFSVHGGYTDAALERGFAESAQSENDLERRDRLQQLVARLVSDLPLVPLYHDEDVYLIRPGLAWEPRNDGCMRVAEVGSVRR